MAETAVRIQVLLSPLEAARLDGYCRHHGYKKSTLIARLVREHLSREGFPEQPGLFDSPEPAKERSRR